MKMFSQKFCLIRQKCDKIPETNDHNNDIFVPLEWQSTTNVRKELEIVFSDDVSNLL